MVECEECGKKLGVLEGYRHPTMGKKHLLCSPCFDQVSASVAMWGEFVHNNSFGMETSKNNLPLNWKKIVPNVGRIRESLDSFCTQKEIYIER